MSNESVPQIVIKRRVVPNEQPFAEPNGYRIAIIGEAPGVDEEDHGRPFVGKSGNFLGTILRDVGIDRNRCFVGNVCQVRPPLNKIEAFPWDGPEIQDGLAQLNHDLTKFSPNLCVLLGNIPLRAAKTGAKISDWRGSLFLSRSPGPLLSRKCLPALHPAGVLREFSGFPLLKLDLKRARDEGGSPDLVLPQRELITNASGAELCYIMDNWPAGQRCSIDIEGGLPRHVCNEKKLKNKKRDGQVIKFGWPCVALSARPSKAYTIAWSRLDEFWHARVLQSFARLMGRLDVPKVLQNSLYDNFVLSFGYAILIRNVTEDTMIKGWEIYAELPRGLSTQASIYTREPHWKDESMYGSTGEGLFRGCALDTAVTIEICEAQDPLISSRPRRQQHYRTMMELLNPFHFMELRGVRYDTDAVARRMKEVESTGWTEDDKFHDPICKVRERLEAAAGYDLCGETSLSSKKLIKCLYEDKKYPPQYKKGEDGKEKLTTDIEALLHLKKGREHDTFLSDVILHRHLEGIRETLQITPDGDGRVRCGYSLEAETGRVKCYTSPTGSGANLQTIQKGLRGNYCADPGYDFFQCDLEGADGWTVACHAARLGDDTMLLDYLAGMKPAKIIALLYWFGADINKLDRKSLKHAHDRVFPIVKKLAGAWLYLGCKRVQHGSSYLMGLPTMILNVLKDSFKESGTPLYMEHRDARYLQSDCFFARYPGVELWHNWAETTVVATGELTAASGHTRIFFGRRFGKDIKDTVKEFLAHEPQNNTTWATNLAMLNLWRDPANRVVHVDRPSWTFKTGDGLIRYWAGPAAAFGRIRPGSLLIEPLHQVHDALCGQWPQFLREWARGKVKSYFHNPLVIAGRDIVIPFEGNYGPSWGEQPYSI